MVLGPLPKEMLWFEYDNYRRHERFLNLSDEEKAIVEQFDKDGCYLCKNAVGEALIEKIHTALDDWMEANITSLVANKRPDGTHPRLIALHEEVPEIAELFSNETVLRLRELLFGHSRSSLQTSITFLQGSQQPLHRDIPVFRVSPGNLYYRIWIALEDTTAENGALTGVKGGHKIASKPYETVQTFYARFDDVPEQDPEIWRKYQEKLKRKYEEAGLAEEILALSKGDLLIWHPLFPHGGSVIENKKASRRSVVLHVSQL